MKNRRTTPEWYGNPTKKESPEMGLKTAFVAKCVFK